MKRRRIGRRGVFAAVGALLAGAALAAVWDAGRGALGGEEGAVIADFLRRQSAKLEEDQELFLGRHTTMPREDTADYVGEHLPALQEGTLSDCVAKSRQTARLPDDLLHVVDAEFIDWDARARMFEERGLDKEAVTWLQFIRFSNVGFDPQRTQAVFWLESDCGTLCGWGGFIFMTRDGEAWTEAGALTVWIS